VGALLGAFGALALPAHRSYVIVLPSLAVAVTALAREAGVISIPLPQLKRQTSGMWAKRYGSHVAAILWGADIGLVYTTWLNFSGIWILTVLTFLTARPALGVALFLAYWFGRVLSVWLAPWLMSTPLETSALMVTLRQQRHTLRVIHSVAILWLIAILVAVVFAGGAF